MTMKKNTSVALLFAAIAVSSCEGFVTQPRAATVSQHLSNPSFLVAPLHSTKQQEGAVASSSSSTKSKTPSKGNAGSMVVHNMGTAKELLEEIAMNEKEDHNLLVVKYHTNFCQLCKRANLTYKKIASEWSKRMKEPKPDHIKSKVEDIRFIRVETTKIDKERTRELGITQFPYVQVYKRGKCVASFATGPAKEFQGKVRESVNFFASLSEDDCAKFTKDFEPEIEKKEAALKNLASWSEENE